ncbi:MAG: hypothetical protein FJ403_11355 [Verrucomicrobia bacterium]|nr:hypothetical protein [Verrucomicrobiota bacterium]
MILDPLSIIFQTALPLLLAPLVSGIIRNWKAKLQNRRGPPIGQPYFDLLKFLRKDMVISERASWVFSFAPYVIPGCPPNPYAFLHGFSWRWGGGLSQAPNLPFTLQIARATAIEAPRDLIEVVRIISDLDG